MGHIRHISWLALIGALLAVHPAAGQAPSQPADAKAVAALIEQLGSAEFAQREAATRALDKIGRPALAALRAAAEKHANLEVRRRAKGLVEKLENSLEQLLEDYRAYGLPLPPKDAPLVRFESIMGFTVNGKIYPPTYSVGFLLKQGTEKEPPHFLRGRLRTPQERSPKNPTIIVLDPTKATTKEIESWIADAYSGLFLLAIQCKARGWDSLAQTFFEERPKGIETGGARVWLRNEAWNYWLVELTRPETDWPAAARGMRAIIGSDPDFDTPENHALLKSLNLALVPSKANPGSVEALIDALVNASSVSVGREENSDSPYVRLVERGFDAIPPLIEHLDDDRLTRYCPFGLNHDGSVQADSYQYRISHMVSDLLERLAGEDFGRRGDVRGDIAKLAQKDKARDWWQRAMKEGEEAYVLAHVLPGGGNEPNDHLWRLLLKKYRHQLPTVYRTLLDKRPQMRSDTVVQVIAQSQLPYRQKVELFIHGARNASRYQREVAFEAITDLGHDRFVDVVVQMLDELPRTPKGSYWRCPEQAVVSLVLRTDDARVWKALDKAAHRVDVGLRMQLLRRVADGGDDNERRKERLTFLRSFLDDTTLRDLNSDPDRFVAVPAGDDFPRLEVRNYAALELGRLLQLDRTPQPGWDDAQWARFRDEVRAALKR